ncbi:MAG: efflux RND transporter periplasmic adaptor subunit, partial [Gammaproteobacteria bacterium]|nr:efflux RND transporter periplasmic adaptor subunit [Gammaproteobacteria bacterium]
MSASSFSGLFAPVRRLAARRGGVPLLVLLATAALIALLIVTRPALEPEPHAERVWPVKSVEIRRQTLRPQLALFGEIVAGRRSELRALVAGPITQIGRNFREGGLVAGGELLLEIDPFRYRTGLAERRAQLREAEVRLDQLQREHRRIEALYVDHTVSERDRDNAELALRQQEAVVEQRRIDVERAERDLVDTRLLAPYAGVIGKVNANLGKQLGINDKVAELTDTGQLEVRFSLSNAEYGRLMSGGEQLVGREVTVTWRVGERELGFLARIARVGAEIVSTTGGVDVYAVLEDGLHPDLRPGAFVSVSVPDREYPDVFVAPESALYGRDMLFVIADSRLAERRIEVLG